MTYNLHHKNFLDINKTLEDYIPLDILNEAMKNLSKSNDIFYAQHLEGLRFNEGSNKDQLKEFKNKINERMITDNQEENENIDVGNIKLDLILKITELIDIYNVDEFNGLIYQIRKIKERADSLNLNDYPRTL